jgi:phosphoserine phosphatase
MCERYAREFGGGELNVDRAVYVGDSPNDEPMFERFPTPAASPIFAS